MEGSTGPPGRSPINKARFKKEAVTAFRRINPGVRDITVTWAFVSDEVPYRVGRGTFRTGHFHVEAPGFRTRTVFATVDMLTGRLTLK